MQGALTVDQLARHNDGLKRKILCTVFKHKWTKAYVARVKSNHRTALCELQTCERCKRFKIGKILKERLNRKERRR